MKAKCTRVLALFLTKYRVHFPSSMSTNRVPGVPSTSTQKMVLELYSSTPSLITNIEKHSLQRARAMYTVVRFSVSKYVYLIAVTQVGWVAGKELVTLAW